MFDVFLVDTLLSTLSSACPCHHLNEPLDIAFQKQEEARVEKSRDLSSLRHTFYSGCTRCYLEFAHKSWSANGWSAAETFCAEKYLRPGS
jgi:hypothetical protein